MLKETIRKISRIFNKNRKTAEDLRQEQCFESCDAADYIDPDIPMFIPAQTLPDGWVWREFDDGSGNLFSPEGIQYFSYDLATKEYRSPVDGHWTFMDGYPYATVSFEEFKKFAEEYIRDFIIAEELACDCVSYDDEDKYGDADVCMDPDPTSVPAQFLPEGWTWREFDDGSGSLISPEGIKYFSYDLSTKEYISPIDGRYTFMDGYPYATVSFEEFKKSAEEYIKDFIIVKEESTVNPDTCDSDMSKKAETIHKFLYEQGILNADIDDVQAAIKSALEDKSLVVKDIDDGSSDSKWVYYGYIKDDSIRQGYEYYFNCSGDFSEIEYVHIFDYGEGIEENVCRVSDSLRKLTIGKCLLSLYNNAVQNICQQGEKIYGC